MGQLPFDPDRMVGPRGAGGASAGGPSNGGESGRPLSVTQLAGLIDAALRERMPRRARVIGEVSGFKERTHWYFDLKDEGAVISCVMWETGWRRFCAGSGGMKPENGHEVVVTGRVEFWARGGRTQFYVEKIEPVGAGALDLKFRQLCEELRAKGWFSPERKRPLPRFPRTVAVVTSRTGAALQDVLDTMRRRCPSVGVAIVDVRVQGDGAATEVARAIDWLSRRGTEMGIDAVLLTRGGGSKEDLWTFNERIVADAVVRCSLPVVAAIGHETDTTIAELVADERCATPTQAAMRLTPDRHALLEQAVALDARLGGVLKRHLKHERERLRSAARHPFFMDPRAGVRAGARRTTEDQRRLLACLRHRIHDCSRRLERASSRLERYRPAAVHARRQAQLAAVSARLTAALESRLARTDMGVVTRRLTAAWRGHAERIALELDAAERALELVGPISVLRRGFSCTLRGDGTVVRSVSEVQTGEPVRTRVLDGTFVSVVVEGEAAGDRLSVEAARPAARVVAKRKRRGRQRVEDGPGLFGG